MVEYVSYLVNRCKVGHHGKTAYERCKGKRAKINGIEFWEAVWWKRKREGGGPGKLTSMWSDGIYVGMKGKSGEFSVSDTSGVWKTRTVKRKPLEERWGAVGASMVLGVPWNVSKDDPRADGEPPMVVIWPTRTADDERNKIDSEEAVPRRPQLKKGDFDAHGYSQGCAGCKAALLGKPAQGHSDACRRRMEENMKHDPKIKKANQRINE